MRVELRGKPNFAPKIKMPELDISKIIKGLFDQGIFFFTNHFQVYHRVPNFGDSFK